jgi:hypothetical protein
MRVMGGAQADMELEAEKSVKVTQTDSWEQGGELGKKLRDEEVNLPASGAKKGRGDDKEDAASMFGEAITSGGREEKQQGPRGQGRGLSWVQRV